MVSGLVFDIKRFSIHDGPGIRTTVFLKGCPLRCWWCHNPESQDSRLERVFRQDRCIRCGACVDACDHGAIRWNGAGPVTADDLCTLCAACVGVCAAEAREVVGREMTVAQVTAEILRDLAFYDESGGGVTFSGGEPLAQPEFLAALLRASKEHEIHTTVDTCGYASWSTIDRLRGDVDLFLYDLKLMDDGRHRSYTGVSNVRILSNIRHLSEKGHEIIVRVPIIPGVNDDDDSIRQIAAFAATLSSVRRVDLLPYHHIATAKYQRLGREYALADLEPPSADRVAELVRIMNGYDLSVGTGG